MSEDTLNYLRANWQYFLCFFIVFCAGIFFLLLFSLDRRAPEYGWLAFLLCGVALLRFPEFAGVVDCGLSYASAFAMNVLLNSALMLALVGFTFALMHKRIWRGFWLLVLGLTAVFASNLILLLPWSNAMLARVLLLGSSGIFQIWAIFVVFSAFFYLLPLPTCFRSPLPEMRWIGAALAFIFVEDFNRYLRVLSLFGLPHVPYLPQNIPFGAFDFDVRAFAYMLFALVMLVAMTVRFRRIQSRNRQVEGEMEAARSVQQILIPEQLPQIAGLTIESAYLPAQEVGGDFFQVIPTPDGATLVVVGDVSGKGLPAAMTVALLVGAVWTLSESPGTPAQLLASLNRRLVGRGSGFATCLILSIEPDGKVVYANAGHLNPYLGGVEFATEANLPLGLSLDVIYEDRSLQLEQGERLTLVTDGVVEATNLQTRELFGFARTQAASAQAAEAIAQAAQRFGQPQVDDITVLTLERCPA